MRPPVKRPPRICLTMLPLPSFLAPSAVYARMLNTLLRREDWAQLRLARYSGKTLRFVVGTVRVGLVIQSDGLVQPANAQVVPDVILTIATSKLLDLPAVLQTRDAAQIASLLHIEGDAGLASLVSELARDLRWDIESDVSRLVGDIPATRLMAAGKFMATGAQVAATRLGQNMAEYLSEESGIVVTRPAYKTWRDQLLATEQRLDALDQRLGNVSAAQAPLSGLRL